MDVSVVLSIVGAGTTLGAVIATHVLNQRIGEKRANQVRTELTEKFDLLDRRLTEARNGLDFRITEVKSDLKADLKDRISEHKAQTERQFELARVEAAANTAGIKEFMQSELRAVKAEILAALPKRSQQAGQA